MLNLRHQGRTWPSTKPVCISPQSILSRTKFQGRNSPQPWRSTKFSFKKHTASQALLQARSHSWARTAKQSSRLLQLPGPRSPSSLMLSMKMLLSIHQFFKPASFGGPPQPTGWSPNHHAWHIGLHMIWPLPNHAPLLSPDTLGCKVQSLNTPCPATRPCPPAKPLTSSWRVPPVEASPQLSQQSEPIHL